MHILGRSSISETLSVRMQALYIGHYLRPGSTGQPGALLADWHLLHGVSTQELERRHFSLLIFHCYSEKLSMCWA